MAKTKVSEWDAVPGNNTDIDSINIAEGCAPSGINNAIRELMSQVKDFQQGTYSDPFNGPVNGTIGATTPAAGAFTTLAASGAVTLSGGTANGVAYLNGSKVLTTGSALTFDGSNLSTTGNMTVNGTNGYNVQVSGGNAYRMYATTNDLVFRSVTAGSDVMTLTYGGNVGIGTSSPAAKLHSTSSSNQFTISESSALGATFDYQSSTGNLSIATNGINPRTSPQIVLNLNGNLGLGVTPSASTTKQFEIGYAGQGLSSRSGIMNYVLNGTYNSGWKYAGTGAVSNFELYNGTFAWYTAPSGTAGNAISFTQAMTLDASGNLLVGTTNGIGKLAVAPASGTGSASTWDNTFVTIAPGGTSTSTGLAFSVNTSTNTTQITSLTPGISWRDLKYKASQHIWEYGASQTEAARIDSSGNLLVGTTSGSFGQTGFILNPSYNAAGSAGIAIQHPNGSASGHAYAGFIYNGTGIGSITQNGTTGVLYNLTSDYRLKNNPVALTGSGAFIDALQPKTWDWWDGSGKGVGFIAHEFMEVAKYSGNGEKDAVDADGKPVYQSIQPSSSEVMANLVAEIQSLRKRLAAAGIA